MATAILLKERSREMTGMQAFLSLILFSSRVEVCMCVRARGMCGGGAEALA